ncbi:MAG: 50S ribosomal protein L9 [Clostridia bacterium]|nr:50S ribosomal protein L9 [Clostridia bacterium]MDQ7792246.1 50S ribosomal protein L9 [Clostridia bacterium]
MKVVLLKDVSGVGKRGEIVNVAEGYGRNFLIPRGIAQEATEGRIKEIAQNRQAKATKEERMAAEARKLAARIKGLSVRVEARAGEGGKLFGSVGNKDVAQALAAQAGIKLDKKKIELKETVKALGSYSALARLHPGVQAEFTVEVVNSNA